MKYWVNWEEGWIGTTPDFVKYGLPTQEITEDEYNKLKEEIEEN